MSRLLLQALAILACMPCASLVAQDLGPLLPPGQSPQRSPVLERYSLEGGTPGAPGPANLSSVLGRLDQGEPQLRLRGAKEIELYRTLAPAVALIFKPAQDGAKIKPADAVIGRVRKVDPVRDLALVEVANAPANATVIP